MEDENRNNIDNTIYRTQEEVNKALGALYIDDKDIPDYSQYEGVISYDDYDKLPGYKSLKQLVEEAGCEKGERVEFDFSEWNGLETSDVDFLRKRINGMQLVGRTIKDIRFISYVYHIDEYYLIDKLGFVSERYFNRSLKWFSQLADIDDSYPYPLCIQMDEPVLIRFDDGDQFEIETSRAGVFNAKMNSILWDADGTIGRDNINPSILLDFCIGGIIQAVTVNECTSRENKERRIIVNLTIEFSKDEHIYSMVFESIYDDYMLLTVKNDDGFVIHCSFKKLLKSMYKNVKIS